MQLFSKLLFLLTFCWSRFARLIALLYMTIHECNSYGEFIEFYDWTGNRRLKCICQSGWQARPITGHRLPGYMSRLCDDSHKIDLFEAAHSNRNFSLVTDCIMPLVFVYNTKTLLLLVYRISFLDVLYPVSYPLPINDIFFGSF